MFIVMQSEAKDEDVRRVIEVVESFGYKGHAVPGASRTGVVITGNQGVIDPAPFANLHGVAECLRITRPYKLVGSDLKNEKSIIRVGEAEIGGNELALIAGVCAVESHEQTMLTAELVAEMGG